MPNIYSNIYIKRLPEIKHKLKYSLLSTQTPSPPKRKLWIHCLKLLSIVSERL